MAKQDVALHKGSLKYLAKRLFTSGRPLAEPVVSQPKPAPVSAKSSPQSAPVAAPVTPVRIPDLIRALEDAQTTPARHDAAARLVALTPSTSVANAAQVFDALKQAQMLALFELYHNRMIAPLQDQMQIRMYRALCPYFTGDSTAARPLIYRAALSTNGYTVSGAALSILGQQVDADAFFVTVMDQINAGQSDPNMVVFAFLVALHEKRHDALETLLETTQNNPLTQNSPLLLFQSARAARMLGALDRAAELIFRAHRIAPDEGMIAVMAVDIGRLCPSDNWVAPAIALGERMRLEIKNPDIVRQVVISLARLYVRSDDPETALDRLGQLAQLENSLPAPLSAIARSQMVLGAPQMAYRTLERFAERNKRNTGILYDMAGILAAQDKVDAAIKLIHDTLPEAEQTIETHAIIGHIYAWSGQIDLALPWLKKVLKKSPNHGSALADMSLCIEFDRDYTLALSLADKASVRFVLDAMAPATGIEFMHQARLRRRMMFLADMAGDVTLARALQREAIAKAPLVLPYHTTEWSGQNLTHAQDLTDKSVMVLAEMGVGDEIRYTSVLHRITGDAAHITLTCDPRLQSLFERSFPQIDVVPVLRDFPGILKKRACNRKLAVNAPMRKIMSDALIERGQDADIWMRGRHFFEAQCLDRTRLFQSPVKPVLTPDPDLKRTYARTIKARAKGRKVVGLSWRGGRRTYNREPHYFELTQWLPLLQDPDLCFVNLQYAMRPDELDWLRTTLGERFIEFPGLDLFDDMEGIAALCTCLDTVVAICTSVLELACAVGTDCLYLMRSPQVTHAIRLSGMADAHGAYQDAVWASCRIIPRFGMKDADVVARGRAYLTAHLNTAG